MKISKLHHCVYALNYHLVLVTKYRRKCLTAPMLAEFEVQAKERCAAWGGRLIEANGEPDHVHLLIELPPTAALAEFVNALKTGTSRRLRTMFAQELAGVYSKPVLDNISNTKPLQKAQRLSRQTDGSAIGPSPPRKRAAKAFNQAITAAK